MREYQTRNYRSEREHRSEYVYGNTARELQPQKRVYENGKRVNRSESQLRARDRALQMNGPYVAALAVVCASFLVMCLIYLGIRSDITSTRKAIVELKNDINTQIAENEAIDYSINTYVSSEDIIKTATTELGMVEAANDQVVFYKNTDSEYTVQYGDIPEE